MVPSTRTTTSSQHLSPTSMETSTGQQPHDQPSASSSIKMRSRLFGSSRKGILLVYALCLWNATCGGTLYMFAGLETDLMQLNGWSAADVDLLYAAGQFGVGLGFISGVLFKQKGVFWTSIYSFVSIGIGSVLFYLHLPPPPGRSDHLVGGGSLHRLADVAGGEGLLVPKELAQNFEDPRRRTQVPLDGANMVDLLIQNQNEKADIHQQQLPSSASTLVSSAARGLSSPKHKQQAVASPMKMAFFYFLIQHGSVTLYQNGLYTGLLLAKRVGLTTGILAAGYGLSAAVYNFVYASLLESSVHSFIYWTGILWVFTGIAGAIILQVEEDTGEITRQSAALPAVDRPPVGRKYHQVSDPADDQKQVSTAEEQSDEIDEDHSDTQPPFAGGYKEVMQTRTFWAVFVQFILTQCVGSGVFIANLKLLCGSYGYSDKRRDSVVTLVSLFNAGGRLGAGFCLDLLQKKIRPERPMILSAVLMGLASYFALVQGQGSELWLWAVGLSYGCNWCVLPAFSVRTFGKENMVFGFAFPVFCMSIAVKLMSHEAGSHYDEAKDSNTDPNEPFCTPASRCFGFIGKLSLFLCACSLLISGIAYKLNARDARNYKINTRRGQEMEVHNRNQRRFSADADEGTTSTYRGIGAHVSKTDFPTSAQRRLLE
ncbi:unnamed protein product [Amoebophrya sp. A25]|nr:unnamed protein product [Amoebophrya sp. A25]|eukprot:GSA25T00014953001.1